MRRMTVLIADDDHDTRVVFGTLLRHHGYEVIEAATGPDAVSSAVQSMPDIIVTEISLPLLDGGAAMARLRADPRTARIPLVVVTARVAPASTRYAVASGCDVFLEKPCPPQRLLEAIQSCLSPRRRRFRLGEEGGTRTTGQSPEPGA